MTNTANAIKRSMFRACDCPCSALAINCCQFGCCISDVPVTDFGSDASFQNADWMAKLSSSNPSLTLRQLVLPGSHDSASNTITRMTPFSASGRTQNVDVYEQLLRGCRYLDIRVGGVGSSLQVDIFHGCLQGGKLESVVYGIATFLKDHPGEFLVLEIVAEFGRSFSPTQKRFCLDLLRAELGDLVFKENDRNKLYNDSSLQTLTQTLQKQVLVLLHPRIYDGFECDGQVYDEQYVADTYGFFNSHRWMRNRWHNTRNTDQLLEGNLTDVQKFANDCNTLLTSQFVLTPGVGGIQDVFHLLVGTLSLRPVSFVYQLYQQDKIDNFIRAHADEPWNIIMMDFVDLASPALISFLIGLNFSKPLHLLQVTATTTTSTQQEEDVTEKAKSFVCRNKMLYLTNVQEDLGLAFDGGTLSIRYKIGDEQEQQRLQVPFDISTEILVGEYAQSEGTFVHVDTEFTADGRGAVE